MKFMSLLLLGLSLVLFTACDDAVEGKDGSEGWNPHQCTEKSSRDCGVDWFLSFPAFGFPENVQILINEKIVIDECDPQPYWEESSTSQIVEFKLRDYANLDGSQKVSLRVYDRKDCYAKRVEISYEANQKYSVENSGGKKRIYIKRY